MVSETVKNGRQFMKRFISFLAAFIILFAMPGIAAAGTPDWTLVPIPASGGTDTPVFLDTDSYLATDITLDKNGNLYVMSGSRIVRFTPEGKVDTAWGKGGIIYDEKIEDSNCEQLNIAADSRGYVYALCRICEDGSPTFIKRYTPSGEADASWYGDGVMGGKFEGETIVDDAAETAGAGIRNEDAIAVDSQDNLYVLYDRAVYRFLPDGTPEKIMRGITMDQPEAVYDEGGGVWFSNAMRIDSEDSIYLFNGYSKTVSKYSITGRVLKEGQQCPLYYEDEENSQYILNQVAFDTQGNIYNINPDGNSISRYTQQYELDPVWCGNGKFTPGKSSEPVHIIDDFEVDAAGNIFVLDNEAGAVCRYSGEGSLDKAWGASGSVGNVNGSGQDMLAISDIISDTDRSLYVLSNNPGEGSVIIAKAKPDFTLDNEWGANTYNGVKGYIMQEYNSISAYGGYVYLESDISDSGTADYALIRVNNVGYRSASWSIKLNGPVWDIQTDSSGNIYVAGDIITKYMPQGNVDESWGVNGSIEAPSFMGEMAIDGEGYLYVSGRSDNCVFRYTPEGLLDFGWGKGGKARIPVDDTESESYYTYFITLDSAGNLYLSDYENNRILRYNGEGQLDATWCNGGEWRSSDDLSGELMPMIRPTQLMIYDGRLYAIWNNRLYVMNDTIANVGVKPPQQAQPEGPVQEVLTAVKALSFWQWVVIVGGLIFSAGAVLAIVIILRKKGRRRSYMSKAKSIKIARR